MKFAVSETNKEAKMAINWGRIKQLLVGREELTSEDIKELEKEFRAEKESEKSGTSEVEMLRAIVDKSNQEMEALRKLIEEERQEKERREREIKEQMKRELEKKKAEALDRLVKATVLAPSDEEARRSWEKLLDADYNAAIALIERQIENTKSLAGKEERKSTERTMASGSASRGELINLAKSEFKTN